MTDNTRTLWVRNPLDCPDEAARGGVVIRGTRIIEKVAAGMRPEAPVDEVFDASRHVLLPGLVNTHHHFYQTLTRAYSPALNKALFPWLTTLYDVWARLDEEQLSLASELAMTELLMSGCTTVADHHYLFSGKLTGAIDRQVEAAERLGVRASLTRGSMSVGKEQGGLPPQSVVQDEATILKDSERLIERYHQRGEGAMVTVALAPCSPFSVSRELMHDSASWPVRKTCACIRTWPKPKMKPPIARSCSACARWTTWKTAAGCPTAPGLPTASISTTTKSSGWVRRAPALLTARLPTWCWALACAARWSLSAPVRRWGLR